MTLKKVTNNIKFWDIFFKILFVTFFLAILPYFPYSKIKNKVQEQNKKES